MAVQEKAGPNNSHNSHTKRFLWLVIVAFGIAFVGLAAYTHLTQEQQNRTVRRLFKRVDRTNLHLDEANGRIAHLLSELDDLQENPALAALLQVKPAGGAKIRTVPRVKDAAFLEQRFDQPLHLPVGNETYMDMLLQWNKLPFGLQGVNRTRLARASEVINGTAPRRYASCAVVGNSGRMKGGRHGRAIDECEFVIRMNHFQLYGHDLDVGRKVSLSIVYPESAHYVHTDPVRKGDDNVMMVWFKNGDIDWLSRVLHKEKVGDWGSFNGLNPRELKVEPGQVFVINPELIKYVHEVWMDSQGKWPQTGMMAVAYAYHTCDKLSIFGFDWHSGDEAAVHYSEVGHKSAHVKHGSHSWERQAEVLQLGHALGAWDLN